MESMNTRPRILIADDSEMNRDILEVFLSEKYDIDMVENGAQAVTALQKHSSDYAILLLDKVMPEMDGFEVLDYMNKYHWIDDVPVIMISSETAPDFIQQAYDLGVTDYIFRPFDEAIVTRRVENTIALYAKQRKLVNIVADQVYKREKSSTLMIAILSHIVEFRNGESGLHTLHINKLTEMLLTQLAKKDEKYSMSKDEIGLISLASALHDIGKISIPDAVLNKPGRFTDEEYAIMKSHAMAGAEMLSNLPLHQDEPLVKAAYEIARWHHERYDGRGYPDGLKGDEIPLSAQVVSIADVYDALTAERCYKAPFPHEKAIQMILNGECGAFNPLLLECLTEIGDEIHEALAVGETPVGFDQKELNRVTDELLRSNDVPVSERLERQLDFVGGVAAYLTDASQDMVFTYSMEPPALELSAGMAERLGLPTTIVEPGKKGDLAARFVGEEFNSLIRNTSVESPDFTLEQDMVINGVQTPCVMECRTIWSSEPLPRYMGFAGRVRIKG